MCFCTMSSSDGSVYYCSVFTAQFNYGSLAPLLCMVNAAHVTYCTSRIINQYRQSRLVHSHCWSIGFTPLCFSLSPARTRTYTHTYTHKSKSLLTRLRSDLAVLLYGRLWPYFFFQELDHGANNGHIHQVNIITVWYQNHLDSTAAGTPSPMMLSDCV